MIKAIRNLKAERNVPKDARIAPIIVAQGTVAEWLRQGEPFLRGLLPAESVTIVAAIGPTGRVRRRGAARRRDHPAARGPDR